MSETTLKEKLKDIAHRLGPHRHEYLLSLAPKDSMERLRYFSDGSYTWLSFPHPPCQWLCGRKLKRFHLTCLTCFKRRYYFKTRGWKNLKRVDKWFIQVLKHPLGKKFPVDGKWYTKIIKFDQMPKDKWFAMPKYYKTYGIFIPTDENGRSNAIKEYIVKFLLTAAERIAEF